MSAILLESLCQELEPNETARNNRPTDASYICALCDLARENLVIAEMRYVDHRDPVRCAVGISLVLRELAKDLYGAKRIEKIRGVRWLSFLMRTSGEAGIRPQVMETMSAALFGESRDYDLPSDCSFWFSAADDWIRNQAKTNIFSAVKVPPS